MNKEKEIEELKNQIKDLDNLNNQYFRKILDLKSNNITLAMAFIVEFLIIVYLGLVIFL